MKKLSQKEIIRKLLREDPSRWWNTYELQKVNTKYGWLGTQADRRARELRESGILESRPAGQYEQFKYTPTEHEKLSWNMQKMLGCNHETKSIKSEKRIEEKIEMPNLFATA